MTRRSIRTFHAISTFIFVALGAAPAAAACLEDSDCGKGDECVASACVSRVAPTDRRSEEQANKAAASTPPASEPASGAGRRATPLSISHSVILGVDHLAGLSHWNETQTKDDGTKTEHSVTELGLLGPRTSVFGVPRVGIDFPFGPVTFGAAFGRSSDSRTTTVTAPGVASSGTPVTIDSSALLLAPRVGFLAVLSDNVAFWVRAGVTWWTLSSETTGGNKETRSGTTLDLEPMLIAAPIDHVAFTFAGTMNLGLGGSIETEVPNAMYPNTKVDAKVTSFGMNVGLLVWL